MSRARISSAPTHPFVSAAQMAFLRAQRDALARCGIEGTSRYLGGLLPVHVLEVGQGEPLLLVHGGGAVAAEWAPLLARLSPEHRCLAVDRPGHGLSHGVDYPRVRDMREHAADFVGRTMDLLELERTSLVASSMGGFFALAFALAHPERVERLILVGAPAGLDRRLPTPVGLLGVPLLGPLLWKTVARPTEPGLRRFYEDMLVAEGRELSDELIACIAASYGLPGNDQGWLGLVRRFTEHRRVADDCFLREALPELTTPTFFVWGSEDRFAPPQSGVAACAAMPDAEIRVLEGAGHLPWLDRPDRCADAIRGYLARARQERRQEREARWLGAAQSRWRRW